MKDAIKRYLDERAVSDPQFAGRYANPKKSIDECCKYITGEAYAQQQNGVAVLSDDDVYGMAVHYYDEDNIVIRSLPSVRAKKQSTGLSKRDRDELRKQAEAEYKEEVKADMAQKETYAMVRDFIMTGIRLMREEVELHE